MTRHRTDIEKFCQQLSTHLDQEAAGNLTDEEIANRIVVSVQQFHGNDVGDGQPESIIPWWVWVINWYFNSSNCFTSYLCFTCS